MAAAGSLVEQLRAGVDDPARVSDRPLDLAALANDASHVRLVPAAVVRAASTGEIARLLRAATAAATTVTFRSGGTSLSGQAVTSDVLIDVRRGFTGLEVLDAGARVRVRPGTTVRAVNSRLARLGRKLGPDPASEVACTVGGVVANNSSGMSCGTRYNSYRTVQSMVVVLPSGTVLDTGAPDASERLRQSEPQVWEGLARLRDRVRGNPESVRRVRQQFAMKNTMGYGINAFLDHEDPLDVLAHLLIGSEGTLGFIAEVTFETIPVLPFAATSLLVFPSVQAATAALPELVATGAATVELMDATSLRVGATDPQAPLVIRDLVIDTHAGLLIEYHASDRDRLQDLAADFDGLTRRLAVVDPMPLTADARVRADLWHVRKGLYAQVAGARPPGTTALLEDVVVPVEQLSATCTDLTGLFEKYGYRDNVVFGHAKDGNIHFMLTDRFSGEGLDRYAAFTEDMVDVVLGAGGSLKAEHGTGRVMAPFVRRQYGDELYSVMRELKQLLDPAGVLNPGVVLDDDPRAHLRDLKETPAVDATIDRCVECGYCEPVCPSRDLTLTPRQRIVVERAIADARAAGDTALVDALTEDFEYDGIQTCAVDGMCQTTCPVGINTGDRVKDLRSQRTTAADRAVWGAAARHWAKAGAAAGAALDVAARMPAGPVTAVNHLARRAVGADRVPLWTPDLPRGGIRRSRFQAATGQAGAVYLPACIGSVFGAAAGSEPVQRAVEKLCARAGVPVVVPDDVDGLCCGTPWSSKGMPFGADVVRQRTFEALLRATDDGRLPVVCDAGSCTESLLSGAQELGGTLRVLDVTEFAADRLLPGLTVRAKLPRMVLHPTCSAVRTGMDGAMRRVAAAVADDVVVPDAWGCCGFAGDRGMLHPELTASATAREAADVARHADETDTVYASASRTCEIGMTRATGRSYVHVVTVLELVTRP